MSAGAMAWDFTIIDMGIAEGSSAGSDDVSPPWLTLEGFAAADNGRCYAWEISTLSAYRALGGDDDVVGTPLPQLGDGVVSVGDEFPVVITPADWFDEASLDRLRWSPPDIRPLIFEPLLTPAETAWLEQLESADPAVLVPRAMATLTAAFGAPVRIEADQAVRAADVLRAVGYVGCVDDLFTAYHACFSTKARRVMHDVMEGVRQSWDR